MSVLVVVAAAAVVVGFVVAWRLLASAADARAEGLFREWRADTAKRTTREALLAAGAATKEALGRELALDDRLPFAAGDVRFVGHPVAFVVFEGHGAVRARTGDRISQVVLVTAASTDAELVEACVRAGRVRWETLHLAPSGPPA